MPSSARVVRVTTFVAAEGRREDLVAAAGLIGERARHAEGCFGAQLCHVDGDQAVVAALSRWDSRAALDDFLSAQRAGLGALAGMLAGPPVTEVYTALAD